MGGYVVVEPRHGFDDGLCLIDVSGGKFILAASERKKGALRSAMGQEKLSALEAALALFKPPSGRAVVDDDTLSVDHPKACEVGLPATHMYAETRLLEMVVRQQVPAVVALGPFCLMLRLPEAEQTPVDLATILEKMSEVYDAMEHDWGKRFSVYVVRDYHALVQAAVRDDEPSVAKLWSQLPSDQRSMLRRTWNDENSIFRMVRSALPRAERH